MYNENLNIDKVYDSQPNINFETLSVFSGSALTINDIPSWLPKANFSRTQYDLVAISPNGEEIVFIDYFTNFEYRSAPSRARTAVLLNMTLSLYQLSMRH